MALKSHIEGVHEGIKNFTCDRCEKSFSLHQSLKAHIKYYHESNGEENKCDLCNKSFSTSSFKQKVKLSHSDTYTWERWWKSRIPVNNFRYEIDPYFDEEFFLEQVKGVSSFYRNMNKLMKN